MRRFFCVKCNKVKRVQQWPRVIERIESTLPEQRIGECNHHSGGFYLEAPSKRSVVNRNESKSTRTKKAS